MEPYTKNQDTFFYADQFFSDNPHQLTVSRIKRNYTYIKHTHEFWELNIVLSGNGIHEFGSNSFNVSKGDVFVIPPFSPHGYINGLSLCVFHLLLNIPFFQRYEAELSHIPGYVAFFRTEPQIRIHAGLLAFLKLEPKNFRKVYGIIKQIRDADESLDVDELPPNGVSVPSCIKLNHLSALLIINLSEFYNRTISNNEGVYGVSENLAFIHAFERLLEKCDEQQPDTKISVDSLAAEQFLSRSAYYALFRKYAGITPAQLIILQRLDKSKSLLLFTSLTIADIALQTGFYDSSHFTHIFTEKCGLSPTDFRNKQRTHAKTESEPVK